MTIHTASYRPKLPTREQIAHAYCQNQVSQAEALAEPRPTSVTLIQFFLRNMNDDLIAGRCTVTCAHRLFASCPRLNVTQVRYLPGIVPAYILVTEGNREWQTYSGLETLAVTWLDVPDDWHTLSMPMKYALRYLAGEGDHKPRWNTLRALEQRGHVVNGQISPSGQALYRQHREEFAHD